jgi:hypothetical protein
LGISVKAEGGLNELEVGEIKVYDGEALYNRQVIDELSVEYDEQGWAWRIARADPQQPNVTGSHDAISRSGNFP